MIQSVMISSFNETVLTLSFTGKVIKGMKKEVLEKISDQEKKIEELEEKEQEMEETYESNILALKEQIAKTMKSNFKDQETKIANISQGVATNAANTKALEATIAKEEQEQESKIANTRGSSTKKIL